MHKLDEAILNVFKKNPSAEFKTGDLVKEIFIEEYDAIKEASKFRKLSVSEARSLKKKKAQLHRKLLYHLNKLEKDKIILNSGFIGKGEKKYRLSFDEGELIIGDKERKVVINKPASITTRIDGYISQKIIQKYSSDTWVNKKNAILLESNAFFNSEELHKFMRTSYGQINDVITINNFQSIIDSEESELIMHFFRQIINDTNDYNLVVNLIINFDKIKYPDKFKEFLKYYCSLRAKLVKLMFYISPKDVRKSSLLDFTISELSKIKVKVNLKNNHIHKEPIFFGRAGPYSLTEKEFKLYNEKLKQGNYAGAIVGEAAIAVDIDKLWHNNGNYVKFREILSKSKKAMFEVCRKQLKYFTNDYVEDGKNLFSLGKTYVRLWNYDYDDENVDNYLNLLQSISEDMDIFSNTQQNVYKSCGLPMRFNVSLSSCFIKFDQDFLSERRYKKTNINSLRQLQSLKEMMELRTKSFEIFKGADRFRIFIDNKTLMDETLKILRYIFNLTQLPSVSLDYRGLSGDLKLTNFM